MYVRTLSDIAQECITDSKEWFPKTANDLTHHCLALAGEVGELCNVIKKVGRESIDMQVAYPMLIDETADVFIYLMNICALLGIDLEKEYDRKQSFNAQRFGRENAGAE